MRRWEARSRSWGGSCGACADPDGEAEGPEVATGAETDPRSYRVDFAKLEQLFPELELAWDAERGARELIGAYREVGLTFDQFEGRSYIRLRQLRHLLDAGLLDDELRWTEDLD